MSKFTIRDWIDAEREAFPYHRLARRIGIELAQLAMRDDMATRRELARLESEVRSALRGLEKVADDPTGRIADAETELRTLLPQIRQHRGLSRVPNDVETGSPRARGR